MLLCIFTTIYLQLIILINENFTRLVISWLYFSLSQCLIDTLIAGLSFQILLVLLVLRHIWNEILKGNIFGIDIHEIKSVCSLKFVAKFESVIGLKIA